MLNRTLDGIPQERMLTVKNLTTRGTGGLT